MNQVILKCDLYSSIEYVVLDYFHFHAGHCSGTVPQSKQPYLSPSLLPSNQDQLHVVDHWIDRGLCTVLKSVVYAKSRSVVNSACSATPTSNLFVGVALIIVCTAV